MARSSTVRARDVISDFNAGSLATVIDRIDLSTIDAVPGGADDSFKIISGAFMEAGQVRLARAGANTLIQINTDADGSAEMVIQVSNLLPNALNENDFVL